MTDEELMGIAVEEAWKGVRSGNGEVGVVVAHDGEPVYRGFNRINATGDITGHAEIAALRAVSEAAGDPFLDAHDLFCTLEPCGMCTCACAWARIRRILYGADRNDVPEHYFELDRELDAPRIAAHARNHPRVLGGVLEDRCRELYRAR